MKPSASARAQAAVAWEVCQGCVPCTARLACKTRAIVHIAPGEPVYIDADRCFGCLKCLPACSLGAIFNPGGSAG